MGRERVGGRGGGVEREKDWGEEGRGNECSWCSGGYLNLK